MSAVIVTSENKQCSLFDHHVICFRVCIFRTGPPIPDLLLAWLRHQGAELCVQHTLLAQHCMVWQHYLYMYLLMVWQQLVSLHLVTHELYHLLNNFDKHTYIHCIFLFQYKMVRAKYIYIVSGCMCCVCRNDLLWQYVVTSLMFCLQEPLSGRPLSTKSVEQHWDSHG